jgi:hypothetical protein
MGGNLTLFRPGRAFSGTVSRLLIDSCQTMDGSSDECELEGSGQNPTSLMMMMMMMMMLLLLLLQCCGTSTLEAHRLVRDGMHVHRLSYFPCHFVAYGCYLISLRL